MYYLTTLMLINMGLGVVLAGAMHLLWNPKPLPGAWRLAELHSVHRAARKYRLRHGLTARRGDDKPVIASFPVRTIAIRHRPDAAYAGADHGAARHNPPEERVLSPRPGCYMGLRQSRMSHQHIL
jgi:hypothetical protein